MELMFEPSWRPRARAEGAAAHTADAALASAVVQLSPVADAGFMTVGTNGPLLMRDVFENLMNVDLMIEYAHEVNSKIMHVSG